MTADAHETIRALNSGGDDGLNPRRGLPEEVFLAVSRLTPLVNVDLLIQDAALGTLLTWRDDACYGAGWHVPGGIIRFKETAAERIRETALGELGAAVDFQPDPIAIVEGISPVRTTRGHFISLLYRCTLLGPPAAELRCAGERPRAGEWKWHRACPADILEVHRQYAPWINQAFSQGTPQ